METTLDISSLQKVFFLQNKPFWWLFDTNLNGREGEVKGSNITESDIEESWEKLSELVKIYPDGDYILKVKEATNTQNRYAVTLRFFKRDNRTSVINGISSPATNAIGSDYIGKVEALQRENIDLREKLLRQEYDAKIEAIEAKNGSTFDNLLNGLLGNENLVNAIANRLSPQPMPMQRTAIARATEPSEEIEISEQDEVFAQRVLQAVFTIREKVKDVDIAEKLEKLAQKNAKELTILISLL